MDIDDAQRIIGEQAIHIVKLTRSLEGMRNALRECACILNTMPDIHMTNSRIHIAWMQAREELSK